MAIDDRGYDSDRDGGPRRATVTPPTAWAYAGNCAGSTEPFLIGGIDVWRHRWESVGGPDAAVADPQYGRPYRFPVYRIVVQGTAVTFAAGEFSNGVWGFYTPGWPAPPPASPSAWRRVAAYVPLVAVGVQVPWAILVVMAHIGGGPNAYRDTPEQARRFAAEMVVPAVVGLVVAAVVLVGRWAVGTAQWTCLVLGGLGCGVIVYGLGWTQSHGTVHQTPAFSTPNPPAVDRRNWKYTPPPAFVPGADRYVPATRPARPGESSTTRG